MDQKNEETNQKKRVNRSTSKNFKFFSENTKRTQKREIDQQTEHMKEPMKTILIFFNKL